LKHQDRKPVNDSKTFMLFVAGDKYSASFLISHGASVATVTPELGDTALHMIASYSPSTSEIDVITAMTDVARQMLEKGLDPNLQNKQGL
jgi:ankyrin repeat protein